MNAAIFISIIVGPIGLTAVFVVVSRLLLLTRRNLVWMAVAYVVGGFLLPLMGGYYYLKQQHAMDQLLDLILLLLFVKAGELFAWGGWAYFKELWLAASDRPGKK